MAITQFSILGNIDSFLAGLKSDVNAQEIDIKKEYVDTFKTFSEVDTGIRDIYDKVIPNIHVLDIDYTIRLIFRAIARDPSTAFVKSFATRGRDDVVMATDGNTFSPIISEFLTPAVINNIRSKVIAAIQQYHTKNLTNNPNLMQDFGIKLEQLKSSILNETDTLEYVRLGNSFKTLINSTFNKKAIISIISPEFGSSNTRFVFFMRAFDTNGKRAINKIIGDAFAKALNESSNIKNNFEVQGSIGVGKIIHFAHSAAKNNLGSLLNSPAYSQLIFSAHNKSIRRSPFEASKMFKRTTGHTTAAIKVSENFSSTYGIFMQFGITLTTDQAESLNLWMGKKERKALGFDSKKRIENILRQKLLEITQNTNIIHGTASDSIFEFIEKSVLESLKSGKVIKQNIKHTKTSTNTSTKFELNKSYIAKNLKVPATGKVTTKTTTMPRSTTGQFISPVSIKNLLNSKLAQQIQNNMGKGTAKAVLNYRTGRFANSAEVTAVTNRDGAVTAFYSYMKNPYATFAPGGAQSSPSSRDPNKLIQLSIRQLATGIMANRLKVVPV